jgi:imidazole glycerol-phosphate synthase subunit HisH
MIAIVDYGLGNIRAFANIFKNLDVPARIARVPADLEDIDKIVLPGVGAFDHAMERLDASGMHEPLTELVRNKKRPVLGICVGMQILADSSEEGRRSGLGWIPGVVRKIHFITGEKRAILPHMGWNTVRATAESPILASLGIDPVFYFLHSYYFECVDPQHSIAQADYGDHFTCAVQAGNVFGVQFHPEKSHGSGIQVLANFAKL